MLARVVSLAAAAGLAALGLVGAPATAETVNSNSADCPSQNSVMTSTG